MNETLEYLASRYDLDLEKESPIEILKNNRELMAQDFNNLGFKIGAEIGVAKGEHAKLLCENIPGVKLYCIDSWQEYDGYNEYIGLTHNYYHYARRRLKPFDCTLIKKFSMDAVKDFEDNSLDFVYIDGAHDFKNVAMDLCEWTKKVRVGGIVSGHDYEFFYGKYVRQIEHVLKAYCLSHGIKPWFILGQLAGHNDGVYKVRTRSWMFVRQDTDMLRV